MRTAQAVVHTNIVARHVILPVVTVTNVERTVGILVI